jgi:hypothetical protein
MAEEMRTQFDAVKTTLRQLKKQNKQAPEMISDDDFDLLEGFSKYGRIFYQQTKELCANNSTVAMYIPYMKMALAMMLMKKEDKTALKKLGKQLVANLTTRMCEPLANNFLREAAAMDPRFFRRTSIFTAEEWDAVESCVANRAVALERDTTVADAVVPGDVEGDDDGREAEEVQGSSDGSKDVDSFWNMLDNAPALKRARVEKPAAMDLKNRLQAEFAIYKGILEKTRPPNDSLPYAFWKTHASALPTLSWLARAYLAVPPPSVNSERLFSRAAVILDNKRRNRLLPKKTEQCLLLVARKSAMRIAAERS